MPAHTLVLSCATAIIAAVYASLAVFQHRHFLTHAHDLGIFDHGVWQLSQFQGVVNVKLAEADGGDATLALDALLELGFKFARTRPAAIQVADRALGEQIALAIGDPELAVTVDPHLAAVKAMVQWMASETSGAPHPAALDARA